MLPPCPRPPGAPRPVGRPGPAGTGCPGAPGPRWTSGGVTRADAPRREAPWRDGGRSARGWEWAGDQSSRSPRAAGRGSGATVGWHHAAATSSVLAPPTLVPAGPAPFLGAVGGVTDRRRRWPHERPLVPSANRAKVELSSSADQSPAAVAWDRLVLSSPGRTSPLCQSGCGQLSCGRLSWMARSPDRLSPFNAHALWALPRHHRNGRETIEGGSFHDLRAIGQVH